MEAWDVSSVANLKYTFYGNGDLNDWDVSSVKDLPSTCGFATNFNDLSGWDVSNVTDLPGTFDTRTLRAHNTALTNVTIDLRCYSAAANSLLVFILVLPFRVPRTKQ